MWQATYEFDCAPGGRPNVKNDTAAAASNQPFLYQLETTQQRYNYFNSKSILDLHKHDVPMALMEAGCSHLSIKIFQYLDSASLLAASLVCLDWQQFYWNGSTLYPSSGARSMAVCLSTALLLFRLVPN